MSTVNRKELHSALKLASKAIEKRNSMPILGSVHLEGATGGLTLTGTDLELGIRVKLSASGEALSPVGVPAKELTAMIRKLSGDTVTHETLEGAKLSVKCGAAVMTLAGTSAEEYPS